MSVSLLSVCNSALWDDILYYSLVIKRFPTKEKLIDYYNQNDHDGPTVVVLFKDIHHTIPTHLDYEIKIYEEDVLWNTNELFSSVFTYIPGMGKHILFLLNSRNCKIITFTV